MMHSRFLVFLSCFFFAPIASAQETRVAIHPPFVKVEANGSPRVGRPANQTPDGINAQDCLDDTRIALGVELASFEGDSAVQVWGSLAGADCKAQTSRAGSTQVCWPLVVPVPVQARVTVEVPVRRLVAGALREADDLAACERLDRSELAVHVLYFLPGDLVTPAASATTTFLADMIGMPAPTVTKTYAGDQRVRLDWAFAAAETDATTGVNVYCVPLRRSEACEEPRLAPGGRPDPRTRCLGLTGAVDQGIVTESGEGLRIANDVPYAFAVASVDDFGNVGALSATACETPEDGALLPEDGAPKASAGGCAVAPRSVSSSCSVFVTVALVLAARRSRRAHRAR